MISCTRDIVDSLRILNALEHSYVSNIRAEIIGKFAEAREV